MSFASQVARSAEPHGTTSPVQAELARSLARVALGWFLLHQGWGKVVREWTEGPGAFYRGNQFQGSSPDWLPSLIAVPYGFALPWFELLFGALLMLGASIGFRPACPP